MAAGRAGQSSQTLDGLGGETACCFVNSTTFHRWQLRSKKILKNTVKT